ncbi:MAG TPA: hypothetical protein VHX86_18665 [Tepidisphaeraceae bacterium]|nr:hypothetical protein [Tepidisphaeraceae bacterium]
MGVFQIFIKKHVQIFHPPAPIIEGDVFYVVRPDAVVPPDDFSWPPTSHSHRLIPTNAPNEIAQEWDIWDIVGHRNAHRRRRIADRNICLRRSQLRMYIRSFGVTGLLKMESV